MKAFLFMTFLVTSGVSYATQTLHCADTQTQFTLTFDQNDSGNLTNIFVEGLPDVLNGTVRSAGLRPDEAGYIYFGRKVPVDIPWYERPRWGFYSFLEFEMPANEIGQANSFEALYEFQAYLGDHRWSFAKGDRKNKMGWFIINCQSTLN
jgi:hypothetical protein